MGGDTEDDGWVTVYFTGDQLSRRLAALDRCSICHRPRGATGMVVFPNGGFGPCPSDEHTGGLQNPRPRR